MYNNYTSIAGIPAHMLVIIMIVGIIQVATGAANITDLQAIKTTLSAAGESPPLSSASANPRYITQLLHLLTGEILDYIRENLPDSMEVLAEDIEGGWS